MAATKSRFYTARFRTHDAGCQCAYCVILGNPTKKKVALMAEVEKLNAAGHMACESQLGMHRSEDLTFLSNAAWHGWAGEELAQLLAEAFFNHRSSYKSQSAFDPQQFTEFYLSDVMGRAMRFPYETHNGSRRLEFISEPHYQNITGRPSFILALTLNSAVPDSHIRLSARIRGRIGYGLQDDLGYVVSEIAKPVECIATCELHLTASQDIDKALLARHPEIADGYRELIANCFLRAPLPEQLFESAPSGIAWRMDAVEAEDQLNLSIDLLLSQLQDPNAKGQAYRNLLSQHDQLQTRYVGMCERAETLERTNAELRAQIDALRSGSTSVPPNAKQ